MSIRTDCKNCKFFNTRRGCRNGKSCKFLHVHPPEFTNVRILNNQTQANGPPHEFRALLNMQHFQFRVPDSLDILQMTIPHHCDLIKLNPKIYHELARSWNTNEYTNFLPNAGNSVSSKLNTIKQYNDFLFLIDGTLKRFTLFDPTPWEIKTKKWAYHLLCLLSPEFTIIFDSNDAIFYNVCRMFFLKSNNSTCHMHLRAISSLRTFHDAGVFYRILLHARASPDYQSRITKIQKPKDNVNSCNSTMNNLNVNTNVNKFEELAKVEQDANDAVMSPLHKKERCILRCQSCKRNLDTPGRKKCSQCPIFERVQGQVFQHDCKCNSCLEQEDGQVSDDNDEQQHMEKPPESQKPKAMLAQLLTACSTTFPVSF